MKKIINLLVLISTIVMTGCSNGNSSTVSSVSSTSSQMLSTSSTTTPSTTSSTTSQILSTSSTTTLSTTSSTTSKNENEIYYIYLDPNGGQIDNNFIQVKYGDPIDLPTPSNSWKFFKGWYLNGSLFEDRYFYYNESISLRADWQDYQTIITYASNELDTENTDKLDITNLLIEEFEKDYPYIDVEIKKIPYLAGTEQKQNWDDFLLACNSIKRLPDVFPVSNLPFYINNNLIRNLTDIVNDDLEYPKINEEIRNSSVYECMTFAIPSKVNYYGYLVNNSLIKENESVETIPYNIKWDELINRLNLVSNDNISGIYGVKDIIYYYSNLLDDNYSWLAYDGEEFKLNSKTFKDTIEFYLNIYNNHSYDYLLDSSTTYVDDKWEKEKIVAKWVDSKELLEIQNDLNNGTRVGEYDFIGLPGVNNVKKTPISIEYNVVSSRTKNVEESYLLAKYLGFGSKGYYKRLELTKSNEELKKDIYAPILFDNHLIDSYFSEFSTNFPGYRSIVESQSFIVNPIKTLVGYQEIRYSGQFNSSNNMSQIFDQILEGKTEFNSICDDLNEMINIIYITKYEELCKNLNKYYIK